MSDGPASGRITAIRPQERLPGRVNLFLDGVFALGMSAELALKERLEVGQELNEARVAALRAGEEVGKATDAALRLLARRPRSEREIRDRLRQKGFPAETIDAAMGKLEGWRYVDDAEFARYWVENREANQPRGRRLLEQELRHKGVDREVVRETIEAAELDEVETALAIGRAKMRVYAGLEPVVARRRLASFLARRGYGFEIVRPVVDQLLGESDSDDEATAE